MDKQKYFYEDNEIEKNIINQLRTAGCVFAEDEARLLISEAGTFESLYTMVEQRIAGLPLEHILGWADFCGIRIAVDKNVFIPRRRSEYLVQQAAALAKSGNSIVDLCCGTGAIGVALAKKLGSIKLHAIDIDPNSVQCALRNAASVGGIVYEGSLYEPLPNNLQGCIDIITANAPYVPTTEIRMLPREAKHHELQIALDGGMDGLDIQRQIASEAAIWLKPGGHLLIESSLKQASYTAEILNQNQLSAAVKVNDELESAVVIGTKHFQ